MEKCLCKINVDLEGGNTRIRPTNVGLTKDLREILSALFFIGLQSLLG
jgi:hypothetical protein